MGPCATRSVAVAATALPFPNVAAVWCGMVLLMPRLLPPASCSSYLLLQLRTPCSCPPAGTQCAALSCASGLVGGRTLP